MQRLSKQRELVHSIVKQSSTHPTAEEVYQAARKSMPNISLGTVYRNLRQLSAEGRIREVQFGSAPDRFDGMLDIHEHFICIACGSVSDIAPTLSKPWLPGKVVTNYRLDYFGQCEACAPKEC
jgi:Fe2+ or Zn2+ uptake regulation protein